MSTIDESALKSSLEASERRLAASRQRRKSQGQRTILIAVLLIVVVPVATMLGVAASRAPEAPSLALTWPDSTERQVLASGQTVVGRPGESFVLSVTQPADWDVTWTTGGAGTTGPSFTWTPDAPETALVASCRPIAQGGWKFLSFMWPTRHLTLGARQPQVLEGQIVTLKAAPGGTWLAPRVFAAGAATWDERVLSLLETLTPPQAPVDGQPEAPTPAYWQVVGDFGGDPNIAAGDGATYVKVHTPELEENMVLLANRILAKDPKLSLKFNVRLDKSPQEGVFRFAYDGKEERRAWVRRAGESAGGPLSGWMKSEEPGNLAPTLPSASALSNLAPVPAPTSTPADPSGTPEAL